MALYPIVFPLGIPRFERKCTIEALTCCIVASLRLDLLELYMLLNKSNSPSQSSTSPPPLSAQICSVRGVITLRSQQRYDKRHTFLHPSRKLCLYCTILWFVGLTSKLRQVPSLWIQHTSFLAAHYQRKRGVAHS